MIDSYDFGLIVINGKRYTKDIIVFPDRIMENWWRREGHKLFVEDLKEILMHVPKPEVLVVGTGYYGRVRVSAEVDSILKADGIELVSQPTREATLTFNQLLESGKHVVGAFHITC